MSILNRINRFIKVKKKEARKAYIKRMGFLAQKPIQANRHDHNKRRGCDHTIKP